MFSDNCSYCTSSYAFERDSLTRLDLLGNGINGKGLTTTYDVGLEQILITFGNLKSLQRS